MRLKIIFLFILAWRFSLHAQSADGLKEITDFGSNPGNLKMFIHLPKDTGNVPKPLVVALHGCSQNAREISRLSGWNKLADINDFIVLYPQQRIINNPSDCFNWFIEHDVQKGS